ARFSPVMSAVIAMARAGKPVMGICNGFQILCEAGLLPGALMRNRNLDFICKNIYITVANNQSIFTSDYRQGEVLKIPIAHGEGNYFADADTIARLHDNQQVIFRYCDADGAVSEAANPNGSAGNIAGICNEAGNVLGMMPHPERASEALLGSEDGKRVFTSLIAAVERVLAV
ncbi:MAG TPA: phosphoribosylformylglycinamidine synthase subunit PurQ, partial [Bacteroidetes bacterium]|nr:phosphoribosylformylglycinamidine synthase subunit PurQ [Bacteroidota bacterium]